MKTQIIAFCLLIGSAAFAQQGKNFIDLPYMEVNGKAELEVVPDEIYLSIHIKESDNKAKKSVETLEKDMVKALKNLGIDIEKKLAIKDFSSNFKQYWLRKTDILTAKQYQLLVHSGATAGKVFRDLEAIGISNIRIQRVDHSKMDELRNQVKIKAIKAAKVKASLLAEAIDQEAGKALFIQELNSGYYPRQMTGNFMVKRSASEATMDQMPEIEFEKIKLEYTIMARFELK